jgi:hypothetical protein
VPYNNIVSRTDAQALIPEQVVNDMLGHATKAVGGAHSVPSRPGRRQSGPVPGPVGAADGLLGHRRHRPEADHRGRVDQQVPQRRGDRGDHPDPGERGERRHVQRVGPGHAVPVGGHRPRPRRCRVLRHQRAGVVPDERRRLRARRRQRDHVDPDRRPAATWAPSTTCTARSSRTGSTSTGSSRHDGARQAPLGPQRAGRQDRPGSHQPATSPEIDGLPVSTPTRADGVPRRATRSCSAATGRSSCSASVRTSRSSCSTRRSSPTTPARSSTTSRSRTWSRSASRSAPAGRSPTRSTTSSRPRPAATRPATSPSRSPDTERRQSHGFNWTHVRGRTVASVGTTSGSTAFTFSANAMQVRRRSADQRYRHPRRRHAGGAPRPPRPARCRRTRRRPAP